MCNLCMLWHSYPPTLQKYSKGGKIHILCESYKPTMNENYPGNLELKENMNAPRKILTDLTIV